MTPRQVAKELIKRGKESEAKDLLEVCARYTVTASLHDHALKELAVLGFNNSDQNDPNTWMANNVLQLIDTFAAQGHSGASAPICIELFQELAQFKPLSPLTGSADEWNDVGNGVYQNNRCSTVFKDSTHVWNIEGKIFREPNGACFTSKDSCTPVVFPYTPTSIYVDVPYTTAALKFYLTKSNGYHPKETLKIMRIFRETS